MLKLSGSQIRIYTSKPAEVGGPAINLLINWQIAYVKRHGHEVKVTAFKFEIDCKC